MERLADRIICVSEFDRQIGIKTGMSSERLITIHNGLPDVGPEKVARPGSGDHVRFVMTARFDRQKDHVTLLRAFATVPEAHLDLVGTGPGLDDSVALTSQLGITDRVHFLGQRTDVAEILSRAHGFVLSSNWEGFPRSTLEGMRAGLPVVVSDVGGSREAVGDGVTGFMVQPRDREELAARLRDLTTNPELRMSMGAAGRERFLRDFTADLWLERTLAVHQDVIPVSARAAN
jgi:glycosyltransferase involved in cell wall biosynthesis